MQKYNTAPPTAVITQAITIPHIFRVKLDFAAEGGANSGEGTTTWYLISILTLGSVQFLQTLHMFSSLEWTCSAERKEYRWKNILLVHKRLMCGRQYIHSSPSLPVTIRTRSLPRTAYRPRELVKKGFQNQHFDIWNLHFIWRSKSETWKPIFHKLICQCIAICVSVLKKIMVVMQGSSVELWITIWKLLQLISRIFISNQVDKNPSAKSHRLMKYRKLLLP